MSSGKKEAMYFGHIIGLAFLPFSVIAFLNEFGVTKLQTIFGLNLMLIVAIGIIGTEVGDIMSAHVTGDHLFLTYLMGFVLCIPAIVYFISLFVAFPENIVNSLPLIMASFLFVEGLSGVYIGE